MSKLPEINRSEAARQITTTLQTFAGDDLTEVRILTNSSSGFKETHSGYFTDHKAAAVELQPYLKLPQTNIYFVLNPINPDLQSRAVNRIQPKAESTTKDENIVRRKWLFVDSDPARPKDISATDREKELARIKLIAVRDWLRDEHGFPEPIIGDSGNGSHLNYGIDLPNDEPSKLLIQNVINAIGAKFSDKQVTIDLTVFNASRICKLYGTWARKGDHTESRPHRQSSILSKPDVIEIVPIERLRAVASLVKDEDKPKPPTSKRGTSSQQKSKLDVPRWLTDRGVHFRIESGSDGWTKFILLPGCLFDESHHAPDAMISQHDDGAVAYKCFHNGCTGHKWDDAKAAIGAPDADHYDPPLRQKKKRRKAIRESRSADQTEEITDTREPASEIDPKEDAEFFLQNECNHSDGTTLRFYRGTFWRWRNNRWSEVSSDNVRAEVAMYLGERYTKVTTGAIVNVLEFVKALTITEDSIEMPCWIDGRAGYSITFSNGVATLDDLIRNTENCLRPHSPAWFSGVALPYGYQPEAECNLWLEMLLKNLESDCERGNVLQEFAGYCLQHSTELHAMMMLNGDGGNGKSCILAGMTGMLGTENVSSLSLDELAEKFKLPRIVGKLANICADMPDTSKTCEGTLKKLVSGDPLEFERKNQQPFTAVSTAKLIFSTNTLPQFYDRSSGLWRRLIIMPFNRQVSESEKITGMDSPLWWLKKGELPGIFMWALRGLRRLRLCGSFTQSEVCNAAVRDHRRECNTALSWITSEYERSEFGEVEKSAMYSEYAEHCRRSGLKALGVVQFAKEVRKAFGPLPEEKRRNGNHRFRVLVGIDRSDSE